MFLCFLHLTYHVLYGFYLLLYTYYIYIYLLYYLYMCCYCLSYSFFFLVCLCSVVPRSCSVSTDELWIRRDKTNTGWDCDANRFLKPEGAKHVIDLPVKRLKWFKCNLHLYQLKNNLKNRLHTFKRNIAFII